MSAPSKTNFAVNPQFRQTKFRPYWFDTVETSASDDARLALDGAMRSINSVVPTECDLAIIGGGFSGLWTGILAQSRYPELRIVVFEAGEIATGGSGRNGGFLHASLTHGLPNGVTRWPQEYRCLSELGLQNFAEIREFVLTNKIDCDWRDAGEIEIALAPHELATLEATQAASQIYGEKIIELSKEDLENYFQHPAALGANFEPDSVAMVNPYKLARGLAAYFISRGGVISESTRINKISKQSNGLKLHTQSTQILTKKVALTTNAFKSLLPEVRRRIVPVFDYQIATTKLTDAELREIGFTTDAGLRDSSNQFHYFRRTADNRILFGGYDAVYYYGNKFDPECLNNSATYLRLAQNFESYFPSLKNIEFEYAWGGAIDTCTRFTAFWGTKFNNRLAYVAGYTGLGVGASRFGAQVLLDFLYEPESPNLQLSFVKSRPIPFPPEPLRWLVIKITQLSLATADKKHGRRNLWLRLLDSLGLGFDS